MDAAAAGGGRGGAKAIRVRIGRPVAGHDGRIPIFRRASVVRAPDRGRRLRADGPDDDCTMSAGAVAVAAAVRRSCSRA